MIKNSPLKSNVRALVTIKKNKSVLLNLLVTTFRNKLMNSK